MAAERTPFIVEVARYRLEDGPGIRSVVFFKGCALRCAFCHNPETQRVRPEIAIAAEHCIECQACAQNCPEAIARPAKHGRGAPSDSCSSCWICAQVCPASALRVIGKRYAPEALASRLLRDRAFFSQSGGGVTLSGGEPALFPQYLSQLLPLLKRESVHVLLQTSAHFTDYDEVRGAVLPYVDTVDVSLKFADAQAHQLSCGSDNTLILANLRRLAAEPHIKVQVSIPLVPGLTATRENLRALSAIVLEVGVKTVRLLPYNPLVAHLSSAAARCAATLPRTFMKPEEIAWAKAVLVEQTADTAAIVHGCDIRCD